MVIGILTENKLTLANKFTLHRVVHPMGQGGTYYGRLPKRAFHIEHVII